MSMYERGPFVLNALAKCNYMRGDNKLPKHVKLCILKMISFVDSQVDEGLLVMKE